jgi:DNA-binding response OmpR family regulator
MQPRLLVVEDNPVLARPLARFLAQSGYTVQHADRCASARAAVGPFDVGVFDILLPDGSGIDLCTELLASGTVDAAVFYTGIVDAALLQQAAYIARVVKKTESADALRLAICAALSQTADGSADGCCTARRVS